jgi:small subunit ribosomal protein S19
MSRSKWKFPIISQQKTLSFWNRSTLISKCLIFKNLSVYNGKTFVRLKLSKDHCGYKLGEFAFTRKFVSKRF